MANNDRKLEKMRIFRAERVEIQGPIACELGRQGDSRFEAEFEPAIIQTMQAGHAAIDRAHATFAERVGDAFPVPSIVPEEHPRFAPMPLPATDDEWQSAAVATAAGP